MIWGLDDEEISKAHWPSLGNTPQSREGGVVHGHNKMLLSKDLGVLAIGNLLQVGY